MYRRIIFKAYSHYQNMTLEEIHKKIYKLVKTRYEFTDIKNLQT